MMNELQATNEIIDYREKSTDELLQLLVDEEDRVTRAHLEELAARPAAIALLTAWLNDEARWQARGIKQLWPLYHAFMTLCLSQRSDVFDTLMQALKQAHRTFFDWLTEDAAPALTALGVSAITPLTRFIEAEREGTESHVMFWRASAIRVLMRLALEHPAERARIAQFVCALFTNPAEDDAEFLALIVDDALLLDREQAAPAVRVAYDRDAVDISLNGEYDEMLASFDERGHIDMAFVTAPPFVFYQPDEIAARQRRWQAQAEAEARRQQASAAPLVTLAPAGYTAGESGGLVREAKVGRNDPCPCGSGKKYKKCCGA